ncbi:pre-mRNA-processing factor SLU7 [Acrasis kona]|uniref:Pre-mRNA-splicing factor SLU7 n=1 Tax=Acrasis kona TaxID=1008807 RepID=A0AAW2YYP3_9EUKA
MSSDKARDNYKQQKALEEARKAGTAEPEKDEEGRDINPHIPQYIAKAPWYLNKGVPSLHHQRKDDKEGPDNTWYQKGARVAQTVTHFRKGACENCGAISHKTKDCVERPRRKGAKLTGKNFEADEVVTHVQLDYDGKRDRWNGYDPALHQETIERFQKIDEERQKVKTKLMNKKMLNKEKLSKDDDSSDSDNEEMVDQDEREAEGSTAVFSGVNPKNKTSSKNLRIREDIAKYLYNLEDDSAHYDPKTHSMRENPLPDLPAENTVFAGDNAARRTGQFQNFINVQKYAYDASEHGEDVHMVGIPSQAELSFKDFERKKQAQLEEQRKIMFDKYGGEQYLQKPQEIEQLAETENYVQYSRDGRVVAGRPRAIKKSKYEEDLFMNGHTSVWGSLYKNKQWGYACCQQCGKREVECTGQVETPVVSSNPVKIPEGVSEVAVQKIEQDQKIQSAQSSDSSDYSSSSSEEDEKPNKKRKRKNSPSNKKDRETERKLPGSDITSEEYEQYKRTKIMSEDPMRNFV